MGIYIKSITARALGPIDDINVELAAITLFYGKNETGKTYLVEHLLAGLFKNLKTFSSRSPKSKGKIKVEGLQPEIVEFTSTSKKKIEDYLDDKEGFPSSLASLLVVKGGDARLDGTTTTGVSTEFLKTLVAGKSTLDSIFEKIPKSERETRYEAGILDGPRRGKISELYGLQDKLKQLGRLIGKVNREYAMSEVQDVAARSAKLDKELEQLQKAKRYQAFILNAKLQELEDTVRRLHANGLEELDKKLVRYSEKNKLLTLREQEYEVTKQDEAQYLWLKDALNELAQIQGNSETESPSWAGSPIGILLLASSVLLFLFYAVAESYTLAMFAIPNIVFFIVGVGLLIAAGFHSVVTIQKLTNALADRNFSLKIQEIKKAFAERFQSEDVDSPTMQSFLQAYEQKYLYSQKINGEIQSLRSETQELRISIDNQLPVFGLSDCPEKEWETNVRRLVEKCELAKMEGQKIKGTLEGLGIDEADYLPNRVDVEYDSQKYRSLIAEASTLREKHNRLQEESKALRREVAGAINSDESEDISRLLEGLHYERTKIAKSYMQLKGELIAKHLMLRVIHDSSNKEIERVQSILSSASMQLTLREVTGIYERIEMDNNHFFVSDTANRYNLLELSTGAAEQVFTALRLTLAASLFGDRKGFIIFDDAFQHSDWIRRRYLIKQLIKYHQSGWQIICFSMDDHIKELFETDVKHMLGSSYKLIELT